MRIIRVFPRRTSATPTDDLAAINRGPNLFDQADEVHISVTFTYDLPAAEELEKEWRYVAPVKIGGPATGEMGGDFVPGRYVKDGYVITSRGCENSCWFCSVWKREGRSVRELPITRGFNLLDDNILACSKGHIEAVFDMLQESKKIYRKGVQLTGGLEAARLTDWHVEKLRMIRPKQMFFAYDTPDDLDPLIIAGDRLLHAGWTRRSMTLRAYVLCGYHGDTFEKAEGRMVQCMKAGFLPMAMLYRGEDGKRELSWTRWSKKFARPAIMNKTYKGMGE